MIKKLILSTVLALVGLTLWFTSSAQVKQPDLPPGVSAKMWVPLTSNSGIALRWNRPGEAAAERTPPMLLAYGTLMVKTEGHWWKVLVDAVSQEGEPKIRPVVR